MTYFLCKIVGDFTSVATETNYKIPKETNSMVGTRVDTRSMYVLWNLILNKEMTSDTKHCKIKKQKN